MVVMWREEGGKGIKKLKSKSNGEEQQGEGGGGLNGKEGGNYYFVGTQKCEQLKFYSTSGKIYMGAHHSSKLIFYYILHGNVRYLQYLN